MSHKFVFVNSEFLKANERHISVEDRGFRFGDGIFETIKVNRGNLYNWERHIKRLKGGLKAISINVDINRLKNKAIELIKKNHEVNCLLRISISRGIGSQGYIPINPKPTVVIETMPIPEKPNNVKLCISSYQKISPKALPMNFKTMQGLNSTLARMEAIKKGYYDAVMLDNEGYVCETSSSNIFWARDDIIYTPSLDLGVLAGTTRETLIEISQYKIFEGKYKIEDLMDSEEVFITNTAIKIVPVNYIKEKAFKEGRITKSLATFYENTLDSAA